MGSKLCKSGRKELTGQARRKCENPKVEIQAREKLDEIVVI